jgi:hypothetical protein
MRSVEEARPQSDAGAVETGERATGETLGDLK